MMAEPTFDHERLDVYRLAIGYVAFSFRIAESLAGPNRQTREQWLRASQSIPLNIAEGNGKQSLKGKSDLKRIVSMLTRLIQRTVGAAEDRFEYAYEYEYRDAEYEYEPTAET